MTYRVYNGTQLLGEVNNKSTGINGLLPATNYQFGVSNYNGYREGPKATINVKTRGIRLIIPTSLTVNSVITLNYQESSEPIEAKPTGMVDGGNKRDIQAKVISVDNDKSVVELLEPLESSSTVSIGGTNLAKHTSNTLTNRMQVSDWIFVASSGNAANFNLGNYKGQTLTMRAWIDKPTVDAHLQAWTNSSNNGYAVGDTIKAGQSGYSSLTFEVPTSFTAWNIAIGNGKAAELAYKEFKVEKGTIATDWSPASEDTQYIVDNTQMTKLQDGSFAAFNGYRAIYFRQ